MRGFVYLITNEVSGTKYVGQHNGDRISYYMGSGHALKDAQNRYGMKNFTRKILLYCEQDELDRYEIAMIKSYDTYHNGYNLTEGGNVFRQTPETKEKIRKKALGRKCPAVAAANRKRKGKLHASYGKPRPDLAERNRKTKRSGSQSYQYRADITKEKIVEMKNKGYSMKQIAKEWGCSWHTLYSRMRDK